jgi:hypothetical protein
MPDPTLTWLFSALRRASQRLLPTQNSEEPYLLTEPFPLPLELKSSGPDAQSGARKVCFHPDAGCLLSDQRRPLADF